MRIPQRALCLWPGLAQLWLRGCWWGLALAITFTILLNFVLAASFVWPAWAGRSVATTGWVVALVTWLAGIVTATRMSTPAQGTEKIGMHQIAQRKASDNKTGPQQDDPLQEDAFLREVSLYREAQKHYLRQDWLETERKLEHLLQLDPLDVDAQMMIAAVYRHTNRLEQSRRALRYLDRMDSSGKWQWEIRQEREKLNRMKQGGRTDRSDSFLEAA